jgi:hypothetical protein
MFLNLLNKTESENFLELSHIAMNLSGIINEHEEAIFNTYKKETGLLDYQIKDKKEKDLVTAFKSSTKKVKKAIIIELAGALDADDVVDEQEKKWIMKFGEELGFRENEIRKMVRWVVDFNDLLAEGYEYINKK